MSANAADIGSIPSPGRSHMPQNNQAHEQLLSPHAATTEACAHSLGPMICIKRIHHNEKPVHCN